MFEPSDWIGVDRGIINLADVSRCMHTTRSNRPTRTHSSVAEAVSLDPPTSSPP
ncbi:hypothetical protein ABZ345_40560 [Lentzea sp. NPDC005914]|uniref:hypothetical protein n=1 Tax=Lentzea sp. NPDC005914 TaxID=3154572 RepID=UPI0033EB269C